MPNPIKLFEQLPAVYQRYASDPDDISPPDDAEAEAGLEELGERFGQFLTLDTVAESLRMSYDGVLALAANTVLHKLKLDQAKHAYRRRLQEILSPDKK